MLSFVALALLVSSQGHPAHGIRPPTGRLLVVGGPGGIPTIQAAVDEAYDGDSILVRQGVYPGFVVTDKELSIVADAGSASTIHGPVTIENLSAGKSVLLAGFLVATQGDAPPLTARSDQGSLRIEECTFRPEFYPYLSYDQPAVVLDNAANVALVTCTLRGGRGTGDGTSRNGLPGQPALQVLSSSVALLECVLEGGPGGDAVIPYDRGYGGAGGDGVSVAGGFVYSSGSEIRAGDGGAGGDNYAHLGGDQAGNGGAGGTGVRVSTSVHPPDVVLLGTLVVAGAGGRAGIDYTDCGGYSCFGDGLPGADGSMISAPAGAVGFLTGAPRQMIVPRVAREDEVVVARFYGRAGDVVQIFASDGTDFVYDPAFKGVKLIPLASAVLSASGTIPPGGTLDLQVPLPTVSKDAGTAFLQAYFRDTSNQRYVATQSTMLELDTRY